MLLVAGSEPLSNPMCAMCRSDVVGLACKPRSQSLGMPSGFSVTSQFHLCCAQTHHLNLNAAAQPAKIRPSWKAKQKINFWSGARCLRAGLQWLALLACLLRKLSEPEIEPDNSQSDGQSTGACAQAPNGLLDCLLRKLRALGVQVPSLAQVRPAVQSGHEGSIMRDMQAAVQGAMQAFLLGPGVKPSLILVLLPQARSASF